MRAWVLALLALTAEAGGTFGLGGAGVEYAGDLAIDAQGNMYVVGGFSGTVDFDPTDATMARTAAGPNRSDAFVAKYDADGGVVWVLTFGSPDMEFARCVVVDAAGSVYAAGFYSGPFDLGGGHALSTKSGRNVFLLKLAADGTVMWLKSFGDEEPKIEQSDVARDLALDGAGNVYLAGIYCGTIDLDPNEGTVERTSCEGSEDGFVVSLDPDGRYRWGYAFGGPGIDWARSVAVAPDGLVLVAGGFSDTVDFDASDGKANATAEGQLDAFVVWLGRDGCFEHLATWGGYGIDLVNDRALAVDPDGAIYVAGEFKGKCDFAPGKRKYVKSSDGVDAYVARFKRDGQLDWVAPLGAGGSDSAHSLCLARDGGVVVTGRFQKRVDFAPGPSKRFLGAKGSAGATNAFVAVYDRKGKLAWARALGDKVGGAVKMTRGNAVALRPDGQVVVFGTFFGDLDVAPGKAKHVLPGAGSADLFLVRYDAKGDLVR